MRLWVRALTIGRGELCLVAILMGLTLSGVSASSSEQDFSDEQPASDLNNPAFVVESVEGEVRVIKPGSVTWSKPLESILSEGTLIDIGPTGVFGVKVLRTKGIEPQNSEEIEQRLRINQPMMTRMDRHLLKDYQFDFYPLKTLLSVKKSELGRPLTKPQLSVEDAFMRYMVRLMNPDYKPKLVDEPVPPPIQAGKKLLSLQIFSPSEDSLFILSQGSVVIPLIWEDLADKYEVFLWPEGEAKGLPLVDTQDAFYHLTVRNTGSYFLQVHSGDERYRSKIVRFSVANSSFVQDSWVFGKDFYEKRRAGRRIETTFPPDGYALLANEALTPISFRWEPYVSNHCKHGYELVLSSTSSPNSEPAVYRTAINQHSIRLAKGTYRWLVRCVTERRRSWSDPLAAASDSQLLILRAATQANFEMVFDVEAAKVIHLEDWF